MNGIFKKLLRRELGIRRYESYCDDIRKLEDRTAYTAKLYMDMYRMLAQQDTASLQKRKANMEEAIVRTFDICRQYITVLFASVVTLFLLYFINPAHEILMLLSLIWFLGFGAKTLEYITNRFCFVDAKLMLVYQAVLEQLCGTRIRKPTEKV